MVTQIMQESPFGAVTLHVCLSVTHALTLCLSVYLSAFMLSVTAVVCLVILYIYSVRQSPPVCI